jgi:hypothetical protein
MADEISIQQLMNRMPKAYLPDVAGDLDAVIQFQFTGRAGIGLSLSKIEFAR